MQQSQFFTIIEKLNLKTSHNICDQSPRLCSQEMKLRVYLQRTTDHECTSLDTSSVRALFLVWSLFHPDRGSHTKERFSRSGRKKNTPRYPVLRVVSFSTVHNGRYIPYLLFRVPHKVPCK